MSYEAFVSPRPARNKSGDKAPRITGHDSVLRAIREQQRPITVCLTSGDHRVGLLVASDKYTLTVKGDDNVRRVIFKSAIEEFFAEETSAAQA
jgi:sRNA-binding regulator protein Hfq